MYLGTKIMTHFTDIKKNTFRCNHFIIKRETWLTRGREHNENKIIIKACFHSKFLHLNIISKSRIKVKFRFYHI